MGVIADTENLNVHYWRREAERLLRELEPYEDRESIPEELRNRANEVLERLAAMLPELPPFNYTRESEKTKST